MKNTFVTVSLIAVSHLLFATDLKAGTEMQHELLCRPLKRKIGSQVVLNVVAQGVAPQYNVTAMNLITKPFTLKANNSSTPLKQLSQTELDATFGIEGVQAKLNKKNFYASLVIGKTEYTCKVLN